MKVDFLGGNGKFRFRSFDVLYFLVLFIPKNVLVSLIVFPICLLGKPLGKPLALGKKLGLKTPQVTRLSHHFQITDSTGRRETIYWETTPSMMSSPFMTLTIYTRL